MENAAPRRPTVLIVGSFNMDYSEVPDQRAGSHFLTHKGYCGGKAVNHAVQLNHLGARTVVFGCVGGDQNGETLKAYLSNLGESCVPVVDLSAKQMTGLTFLSMQPFRYFHVSGANDNSIVSNLNQRCQIWSEPNSTCCLADMETPAINVETAFTINRPLTPKNAKATSQVVNVLDASYPARQAYGSESEAGLEKEPLIDRILKRTDVLMLRRNDAEHLLSEPKYVSLAKRLVGDSANTSRLGASLDFEDFARYVLEKGPQVLIFSIEAEGCLWALRRSAIGRELDVIVGQIPGGSANQLLYPNSAHAAFAGALTCQIAERRLDHIAEDRQVFLASLPWGSMCHFATAAYICAASMPGASESMATRDAIEAVRRRLPVSTKTIVSIDVVNHTKLLSGGSHHRARVIRDVFREVESMLRSHGADGIEWRGDGFWVVFDAAVTAVDAALSVCNQLSAWKPTDEIKEANVSLKARIAVNTGDVYVGTDHTVDGLPANLTKRAESRSEPGYVYVTEWTRAMLEFDKTNKQTEFEFTDERAVEADSKHAGEPPFMIYRVQKKA